MFYLSLVLQGPIYTSLKSSPFSSTLHVDIDILVYIKTFQSCKGYVREIDTVCVGSSVNPIIQFRGCPFLYIKQLIPFAAGHSFSISIFIPRKHKAFV